MPQSHHVSSVHFAKHSGNSFDSERNSTVWCIRSGTGYHCNAINDWTHTDTEGAPSAIFSDVREVGFWVKCYCLVARVVACHVALATVDAHLLVNDSNCLLFVVQVIVCSDMRQSYTHHVLWITQSATKLKGMQACK